MSYITIYIYGLSQIWPNFKKSYLSQKLRYLEKKIKKRFGITKFWVFRNKIKKIWGPKIFFSKKNLGAEKLFFFSIFFLFLMKGPYSWNKSAQKVLHLSVYRIPKRKSGIFDSISEHFFFKNCENAIFFVIENFH